MAALAGLLLVYGGTSSGARAATVVAPDTTGAAWAPDDIAKLRADLDAMLDDAPALRGAHAGILAIDTASGDILYARNADDEFQPASTLKLVVGSAVLEKLGASYRFSTNAYRNGEALVLVGGGDPFLAAADLDDLAATVARALPRGAKIGLFVDAHRYDDVPYAPGWTWDDFLYDYAAPSSALTVEENVLHVTVTPGSRPGDAAQIEQSPLPWGTPRLGQSRAPYVVSQATTLAAGAESTLDLVPGPLGETEVIGGIATGASPEHLDAAVADPPRYAQLLSSLALVKRGIDPSQDLRLEFPPVFEGQPLEQFPPSQIAWDHESPPLSTELGPRFWIPSDNLVGELLLKELGYVTGGVPGTTAKGIAFEKAWLQSIGVDPATVTLADGCGMSQYDRITPRDLVAILQHDWNGPNRQLILASLPIGGVRGTIEGIAGTAAAGRTFAKTGSMMHIRGLAGYLATERHGAVTFAFNVDDWNGDYPSLAKLRAQVLSRIVGD